MLIFTFLLDYPFFYVIIHYLTVIITIAIKKIIFLHYFYTTLSLIFVYINKSIIVMH